MKKYIIIFGVKRLGFEIAKHFAKKGFNIILTYNNSFDFANNCQIEIQKNFDVEVTIQKVVGKNGCEDFFKQISKFDIEYIFHCQSVIKFDDILSDDFLDNFQESVDVHAKVLLEIARFVKKRNSFCDIISILGDVNYRTKHLSYSIGKKIQSDLIKFLAYQLKDLARINGISPSFICDLKMQDPTSVAFEVVKKQSLISVDIFSKNIISSIEFLIENKCINGQVINVNAGGNII